MSGAGAARIWPNFEMSAPLRNPTDMSVNAVDGIFTVIGSDRDLDRSAAEKLALIPVSLSTGARNRCSGAVAGLAQCDGNLGRGVTISFAEVPAMSAILSSPIAALCVRGEAAGVP
jgi:hypothetical protein